MDQVVSLDAIDSESEAVVVECLIEIKASAGEANRCDLDFFSTVVAEIQQSVIRDVGSRGGDVADVSAIELLPVDIDRETVVVLEVLEVGGIERFVEIDRDGGTGL